MDNGPHAFDLIRHLLGEIEHVQAKTVQGQDLPVEDTAQIHCHLENGAWGIVDVSWTLPVPSQTYLEIYGEEGSLTLDFEGISYKFKTWSEWKRVPNQNSVKEGFARQMDHFVESIQNSMPRVTSLHDAVRSQELIAQAYDSLKN
jgi:predicted dehydrogenase